MRTSQQTTSADKQAPDNGRQEPTRDAPPRVVVNGEALNLTLDTELRPVENTPFKASR